MLNFNKVIIATFTLLILIVVGCSKNEPKEITIPEPLKMKSEYSKLVDDKIIEDMVTETITLLVDSFNERDKNTGMMKIDKSVNNYFEFIDADAKKSMNDGNNEKADFLIEIMDTIVTINKSILFSDPILDKNDSGDYEVVSNGKIEQYQIENIKNYLLTKLDKYFESQ